MRTPNALVGAVLAVLAVSLVACTTQMESEDLGSSSQAVRTDTPVANPPTNPPTQDPGASCGTNNTGGDEFDYQCPHGQFCNSNGHCRAQKPVGGDCSRSGVCSSANCDCTTGTCGAALPPASVVGHILYDLDHATLSSLCKAQAAIDPWIAAREHECGMADALGRDVLDSVGITRDANCPAAKPYLVQTRCSFTVKQVGDVSCHADANGQYSSDMCFNCHGTSMSTGVNDQADYICTINLQRRANVCPSNPGGGGGGGGDPGGGGVGPIQTCSVVLADSDPAYCEDCGGIPRFLWDGDVAYAYDGCSLLPN